MCQMRFQIGRHPVTADGAVFGTFQPSVIERQVQPPEVLMRIDDRAHIRNSERIRGKRRTVLHTVVDRLFSLKHNEQTRNCVSFRGLHVG